MDDVSVALRQALIEAYLPYVRLKLNGFGIDAAEWAEDLVAAEAALAEALEALLGRPFAEQSRGPLELFQEAMHAPTEILDRAGIPPPDRDMVAESALPGDSYNLAPASSRALGEAVWSVHLAWGATKAAALRGESEG